MPKGFHFSRRRYSAPTAFYFRSSVTRRFSVRNWFSFAFFLIFSFTALDLSAQVNEAWVATYNGPGDFVDQANALAVDDSGNVYVTGWSTDSVNSDDYATIKYKPNGDILWVRRYAGPGNDNDYANALAVDNSGNAYVTGISWGETSEDYATIKYSPTAAAKGDMNSDGSLTAADAVLMVNCVYLGTGTCILSIADVNCSGGLTAADAVIELQAVYLATPFPC